ncbi:LOW QUALITY PROTEIN: hypothetical protein EUGRSUZ_G01377 [Eucalyptus grandis]|uniref:Uncharacterized protein n=1 Tax=Eucalyptus grandis TaxID=71139 RepID=A0ACC3K2L0_EUCGR|nr:LOW QUALITY PROTEIN: hypothetical protein EUGRSUZ_G01377 [Eucalyptus grandis]
MSQIIQALSSNGKDDLKALAAASLLANSGITLSTGNYIVTVSLNTPKKDLTLIFDTGNTLTWTHVSRARDLATLNPTRYQCRYTIIYSNSSFSRGFFTTKKLTISPMDAIDNFEFDCGKYNRGLFGGAARLIGLSDDNISIVGETATKYGKYFSYCLASTTSSTGHLTFGEDCGASSLVSFTPLSKVPQSSQFYGIKIVGISVGGNLFSSGGAVIDSGTVIAQLPPTAYIALRTAFRKAMANYMTAPALAFLDTCYEFSKRAPSWSR